MNADTKEKLAAPRNYRLKRKQVGALAFLSEVNNDLPIQHFVRTFTDFGIKVCALNGNQIPCLDQIQLRRALVRRANRDAKRSK